MRSIATTRRYELFIVLAAATAYVIRRLLELAATFDLNIRIVQNAGVSNTTILRDLASFDYNQNVIFPTVAGGILFMAAWYVFHYHAFPRIREKRYGTTTNWLIVLTIGLTLGSILLYSFFHRKVWEGSNEAGQTVGLRVHGSDLINIPVSLLAALVCLLIYEAFAQLYYRTIELYEQQGQSRHRGLQYLLLTVAAFCLILWVFVGSIANFAMGGGGVLVSLAIVVLTILFHFTCYSLLFPYYDKHWPNAPQSDRYHLLGIVLWTLVSLCIGLIWGTIAPSPYPFLFLYLLPSSVGFLSAYLRRHFFRKTQKLQTQVLQKSTELDTLRSQVNPHFLFNALNTLYSVALKESSERTADGIQKLGDMMRFMLDENNQDRIPLSKEIGYLHNFLNLQRMRLDEGHEIEIRVNIQEPEKERYLAPMVLNPFVENAFKHGISLRQPSWIYITLTLDGKK